MFQFMLQFVVMRFFITAVFLLPITGFMIGGSIGQVVQADAAKLLDRVAVIVNENIIMRSELYAEIDAWKNRLQQRNSPIPDDQTLIRQVTEQLVLLRLQLAMAKDIGIRVSDQEINQALLAMAQHNYLTLDEFRLAIENQGQSYQAVRSELEQQLSLRKLQQAVISRRVQVTDNEVNNFLATEKGRALAGLDYKLFYIRIPIAETLRAQAMAQLGQQVSEAYADLQQDADEALAYLDKTGIAYTDKHFPWQKLADMPSLFAGIVPQLSVGEAYPPLQAQNAFHLIKLLEVKSDTPKYVEEIRARHILLKPNLIRDREQTQLLLTSIRSRILAGESFDELAATYSDDSNSAVDGGELGWSNPDIYVPAFRAQLEHSSLHVLSPLFETEFGWHITEVLGRRQVDTAMQVERDRIKQYIFQQKLDDELPRWLNELRGSAYVDVPDPALNKIING